MGGGVELASSCGPSDAAGRNKTMINRHPFVDTRNLLGWRPPLKGFKRNFFRHQDASINVSVGLKVS